MVLILVSGAAGMLLPDASAFAADCEVISATHGGHWKGEALSTSQALAAKSTKELKARKGWRSITINAVQVKPNPFWKIVRPAGVPEGVIVGSYVTSHTYTTCFTGVVVPYVCTSGSRVCRK
jgi:hypothetical protein